MLTRFLRRLAHKTWRNVTWAQGVQGVFSYGEETITETLLRDLNMKYPQLEIRSFNKHQEGKSGADLEWWIGTPQSGWVCLLIQAKMLKLTGSGDGAFPELWRRTGKMPGAPLQIERLLEVANVKHAVPLHLFYIGWGPRSVSRGLTPWLAPKNDYGCSLAFTTELHSIGRTNLEDRLSRLAPSMRPWHRFFGRGLLSSSRARPDPRGGPSSSPSHTLLEDLIRREPQGTRSRVRSVHALLPHYLESNQQPYELDLRDGYQRFDSGGDLGESPRFAVVHNVEHVPLTSNQR